AIDGLKSYINKDFSSMGANNFKIRNRGLAVHIGGTNTQPKVYRSITYLEAQKFKSLFQTYPVSIQTVGTGTALVKYKNVKSNPNVIVFGADESYAEVESFTFLEGRNFSENELSSGRNSCILGYD